MPGRTWRYVDNSGKIQGPFEDGMMKSWHAAKYLDENTLVSDDPDAPAEKFKKIGDFSSVPFGGGGDADEEGEEMGEGEDRKMEEEEMMIPEETWEYQDEEGKTQGPFKDSSMQEWFEAGYFHLDTKLKRAGDDSADFKTIREVIPDFLPEDKRLELLAEKKEKEVELGKAYHYIDDDGGEKGPYSEEQMREWYRKGYFHENTKVRKSNETDVYPMGTKQLAFKYLPRTDLEEEEKRVKSKNSLKIDENSNPNTTPNPDLKPDIKPNNDPIANSKTDPETDSKTGPEASTHAPWQAMTTIGRPPPPLKTGLSPGDEKSTWEYLDDSGKKQGPWTTPQMRSWFERGMLAETVRVRLTTDPPNLYIPIAHRLAAFKLPPGASSSAASAAAAAAAFAAANAPPRPFAAPPGPRPGFEPAGGGFGAKGGPQTLFQDRRPGTHMAMAETLDPVSALSKTLDSIDNRSAGGAKPQPFPGGPPGPGGMGRGGIPGIPGGPRGMPGGMPGRGMPGGPGGFGRMPRPATFQNPRGNVNPYSATASFNKRTGRFSSTGQSTYWQRKGIPEDRAGRQMFNYFDHARWQDQLNAQRAAAGRGNKKRRFN
ncbi:hypothetical protein AAMO2058_000964800 [Amorphochlora amoebiformis]